MQVGVAKAVDRLLGVAHQKQRVRPAGAVNRLEDLELQRVGVLEFVDEELACAMYEISNSPGYPGDGSSVTIVAFTPATVTLTGKSPNPSPVPNSEIAEPRCAGDAAVNPGSKSAGVAAAARTGRKKAIDDPRIIRMYASPDAVTFFGT